MFLQEKRLTDFFPVMAVLILIFTLVYSFTFYYLLLNNLSILKIIAGFIVYITAFMTIYCQFKAILTSPGIVESSERLTEDQMSFSEKEKLNFFFKKYCKICKHLRPERSHHCKTCKRCFLKMDHHCPWIGNCVGLNNQKYFYLFLFYSSIGCLSISICFANEIYHYEFKPNPICKDGTHLLMFFRVFSFLQIFSSNEIFLIFLKLFCNLRDFLCATFTGVIAISMFCTIGYLFCYQTYLFMTNKTSIEHIKLKSGQKTPYCFESKMMNLRIVLGFDSIIYWFIPVNRPNPYNDGNNFPKPNLENFLKYEN